MSLPIPMKSERGQTMTEFALVLPLLVLLLFGVVQFGIAFNNYLMLTDAVRAGARKGTVARHMADPVEAVEEQVRSAGTDLDPDDLDITVTSTWEQGSDITVSATYPYSISLLGLVVKSGELTSTTTERVER
jgi:Flp pilus assembly protein TadG